MKRIILSVNKNPKYLYFLPLTCWAWRQFGWEPLIFHCGTLELMNKLIPDKDYEVREVLVYPQPDTTPYKTSTIAQVSRLYGACVADGMLMTGDMDMVPLSDYWKPNPLRVNCYGRDLTDYHYPICYIAMDAKLWCQVMDIKDSKYGVHLRRDLRVQKNSWVLDQDIITERLNTYKHRSEIVQWKRGTDKRTGYPVGRVDRSNWTLNHETFIDCHLPHDMLTSKESFDKVMRMLKVVWPKEDFKWFVDYTENFKKLI